MPRSSARDWVTPPALRDGIHPKVVSERLGTPRRPSPWTPTRTPSRRFRRRRRRGSRGLDILDNTRRRRSHIVSFARLPRDLLAPATTPDNAFITPNLRDDMHDAPVAVGDAWLERWVPLILASPAFSSTPSLLIITWDEGIGPDQHIATILAGSAVKRHFRSTHLCDHYSLLHTIEVLWHLRPLTRNDAHTATLLEFLR